MHEKGVEERQIKAVISGIAELLMLTHIAEAIQVVNFGIWRNSGHKYNGQLAAYQSIDWYIQRGWETSSRRNQINGCTILNCLAEEPWRDRPHYDVVILQSDMYSGFKHNNFIIGLASRGIGTVLSLYKFLQLEKDLQYQCIKTEAMHEMAHAFGLIPNSRVRHIEHSLGKHCTNICVMRQGLRLPDDWINMTNDRLRHGALALCGECQEDLLNLFENATKSL